MSRWGSSALAGSLSNDGVRIKILVVIQPYTHQPINHEMLQINEFNQGGPELPEGNVTLPSPPAQKSCRRLLLVLGCQSRQEKLQPFILEEKQKQDHRGTLGESGRKVK